MGDYWTNPTRHPEDVGIGILRRTVNYNDVNIASPGVPIGALEAGAVPLLAHATVITAFNAATTNVLILGTTADDDGFMEAADITEGTPGLYPNHTGALSGIPLAADAIVYAKYTQSGTAATTGKAVMMLEFCNKREVDGQAFPNN